MNAIDTSFSGMMRAMAQFDRSAAATVHAVTPGGEGSLEAAIVSGKQAELAVEANAAVMRTAADMEKHIINILA